MTVRVLWAGLVVLLVANLIVAVAWFGRDTLVAAGLLAEPPPSHIDLPSRPLPTIEAPRGAPATVPAVPERLVEPVDEAGQIELAAPDAAPLETCAAIGPFETHDEAAAASARIESAGGETRIATESEVGEPDYFVYIEPAASRDLAHRIWQELVGQGIDAFVIPRGDRENGVSVGVFTIRELAVAQRDRVAELGYMVSLRAVRRSHVVYVVVARNPPGEVIADLPVGPCEDAVSALDVPGPGIPLPAGEYAVNGQLDYGAENDPENEAATADLDVARDRP